MTIEEKLNLIGFKGFVHLKKEQRDNKNRKVFSSSYDNKEFDIVLIKETKKWTIEKINDGNLIANLLMLNSIKIDDIIFFFKNYYYKDEELSKYL
ncbi:hypothetical protein [Chryseobacterium echinoideorum]|uniref:hypothetical protein n=1 Tax=Chryseobacterium echinoideorum TaxID=1549648 RepID=UPI00118665D1|nr:hypothetical protein [Chryseobacterium echinoideorum]